MIELTLQILRLSEFKGVSKNIDIAKGKYEIPLTIKDGWKHYKRFKK